MLAHTWSWHKTTLLDVVRYSTGGAEAESGERRQELDQLKVLECYGSDIDVLLSMYKRGYVSREC